MLKIACFWQPISDLKIMQRNVATSSGYMSLDMFQKCPDIAVTIG